MIKAQGVYRRREPEKNLLYDHVEKFSDAFVEVVASDPSCQNSPRFVQSKFEKFLKCGVLSEGFYSSLGSVNFKWGLRSRPNIPNPAALDISLQM